MKTFQIFACIIFLFTSACQKDKEQQNPQPPTLAEEIESIIQPIIDDQITVGAAVGIIKPGGEKEMFFFGEKNKDHGDIPDENTLFEIGSITKTMTATVLADMVLNGEIGLEDPVENHLPGIGNFPDFNGEKITFKHLANHTSSLPYIPDNYDNGYFDEANPFLNYDKDLMYEFLNSYTLTRPMGSEEEYSNFAMGLLGHSLAEARGTSFQKQLQEVVFQRCNLNNTHTIISTGNHNFAQPYSGDLQAVPAWDFSDVTLGAGGVKSSMKDMMIYLEENMGYGNSDLKDVFALTHQNTQTLNYPTGIGLAWVNSYREDNNTTLTWHNGGTAGTVSFLGFVKELDTGVVLWFNTEINERTGGELLEVFKGIEIIEAVKKY